MRFGIYVHLQGPSAFSEVARDFDGVVRNVLQDTHLSEVDGLTLSFRSTSLFEAGVREIRRKVRRNYTRKLITGGTIHHVCVVEIEAAVADAEVVDASSEPALFEYVRSVVSQVLPAAFKGFPAEELALLQSVVAAAAMSHEPRW